MRVNMNNLLWTVILILVLSVYASAGGSPLNDHAGSETGKVNGLRSAPEETNNRNNQITKETGSINRGKDLYLHKCALCHGEKADGNGPAASSLDTKPANLKKMSGMHSDEEIAATIENGRGAMPAWKNILSESQIRDMVNYVQSLSGPDKVKRDHSY
jgi:mono/diheme cytochrome c family protein